MTNIYGGGGKSYLFIKIFVLINLLFNFSKADITESSKNNTKDSIESKNTESTDSNKNTESKIYRLNPVTAISNVNLNTFQSGSVINQSIIESNPSGNGDITSLLRILPNVQFDNSQLKSTTPGEIDPANISISGGLYYQNNFQLDGFNMNNDLDPAASNYGTRPIENSQIARPRGRSQGLNIDTSLLDSIIVQDSNISAEYGGFSGGLIQANTKRATKKYGANVSYQITQGDARYNEISLTNYHVYGNLSDFINSSFSSNQPRFIKHIVRASFESKFNENAGIIASFSTTQSFIPLKGYEPTATTLQNVEKTQTRQHYNLFLKAHYDVSENLGFEASYSYMPEFNKYFLVNAKDSDFFYRSGGHNLGLKTMWNNALGNLNANINFSYLEDSRSNSASNYKSWYYSSEKNWSNQAELGASEGGYGNVDNKQIESGLKITQNFEPFRLFNIWTHEFSTGIEMGYAHVYYKRHEDTKIAANTIIALPAGQRCTDTNWCTNTAPFDDTLTDDFGNALTNGYYFGLIDVLGAGEIALNNFTFGSFIEDSMKFALGDSNGELDVRFGVRLDYELYMNKAPIAPRLAISYAAPWNNMNNMNNIESKSHSWKNPSNFATNFTFGYNRYYGRNIFAFRLLDGQSRLNKQYSKVDFNTFNPDNNIAESTPYEQSYVLASSTDDTSFTRLKVPYDDELMFGIMQNILHFKLDLKYIHRFGRDQVMTKCSNRVNAMGECINTWANDGQSDSDIFIISLQNDKPLKILNVSNFITFGFDYTILKRNFNSYNDIFANPMLANQIISYNGQFMRYIDRPAQNFFRPYTFRITTTHTFNLWKTKWLVNNFFRFRSSYNAMIAVNDEALQDSYNGVKVDTFRTFNVPSSFTWDMRFGFEINVGGNNAVYANLDIFNILDSKNIAIMDLSAFSSSASATAIPTYEVGRQFWLQVGYKF